MAGARAGWSEPALKRELVGHGVAEGWCSMTPSKRTRTEKASPGREPKLARDGLGDTPITRIEVLGDQRARGFGVGAANWGAMTNPLLLPGFLNTSSSGLTQFAENGPTP